MPPPFTRQSAGETILATDVNELQVTLEDHEDRLDALEAGGVTSVNGQTGVVVLDPDDLDDTSTTNKFTTAGDITKLAGIETGADVTDATNVAAAGAVMEADTSTALMQFVVDEDDMASDSATKVPTQQSVKAYVDAQAGGAASDPTLYARREMQVVKNAGAATSLALGMAAWTLSATATSADDADGPWVNHATGTTSGQASGALSGPNLLRRDWGPIFVARIKTAADVDSIRLWIGLVTGNPDTSDTPSAHLAAFRFSTGASDVNWQGYTDGGDGSGEVSDTGVAVTADTVYLLRIDCSDSANVKFYVDDVLVATNDTDLPTATTLQFAQIRVTTLTNASRSLKWGRVAILHV